MIPESTYLVESVSLAISGCSKQNLTLKEEIEDFEIVVLGDNPTTSSLNISESERIGFVGNNLFI